MSDNTLIAGQDVHVVSLRPGQAITGTILGTGPQVALRHKGDLDAPPKYVDTLLLEVVNEPQPVAVILTDRLTSLLALVADIIDLRRCVTIAAKAVTTSRGFPITEYGIEQSGGAAASSG